MQYNISNITINCDTSSNESINFRNSFINYLCENLESRAFVIKNYKHKLNNLQMHLKDAQLAQDKQDELKIYLDFKTALATALLSATNLDTEVHDQSYNLSLTMALNNRVLISMNNLTSLSKSSNIANESFENDHAIAYIFVAVATLSTFTTALLSAPIWSITAMLCTMAAAPTIWSYDAVINDHATILESISDGYKQNEEFFKLLETGLERLRNPEISLSAIGLSENNLPNDHD